MQVPIATRRFVFIPMDLQDLSVGLLQVPNKQWGYQTVHGTNPVTYDLPIPFEEAPFTVAISTGNSGNHASCGGFTKTTIVLRAGTTAGVWDTVGFFIIGCQLQWGFTNNTGRPYITFPFKFSNVFTAISCICHNGSPSEANTVYNVSISGMNIGASGGGSGKYWCAFGVAQQQWGNSASLSGYVAVCIFPISFTTTDYTAVATGVMSAADATFGKENYVNNILWDFTSESQVAFRLSHLDRPTLRYIAIGF